MRTISPFSFFLLLVFSSISFALGNEFWKSLKQVADQVEPEAREYFLRTGKLPSESTSSTLPSTDTFRHPHGPQRWTPFSRPQPAAEIFQPTLPNHYIYHSEPSPSSQISHGDHAPAPTFQSNRIGTEPLHNIGIQITPPMVLSLTERQLILQQVADRYQGHFYNDATSQIHPLKGDLTPQLVREAFGFPNIQLRHFKEDIILIPRLNSEFEQDFTKEHGGMSLARDPKYHMYVWKRHAVQGGVGSVFQLVGAIETAITTTAIRRNLVGYQTGRKVFIIGPDSIFDDSLLAL